MTRDQELWAMALHVEQRHGERAAAFIAAQIERNRFVGERGGVDLWEAVGRRFDQLGSREANA